MTDKELLELSAKAAGYNIWWKTGACKGGEYESAFIGEVPWNPLTDDGDALRLAVKLRMALSLDSPVAGPVGFCRAYPFSSNLLAMDEWANDDRYTATRRAITRAAAAIGKEMP
jgi:hypothetical protein